MIKLVYSFKDGGTYVQTKYLFGIEASTRNNSLHRGRCRIDLFCVLCFSGQLQNPTTKEALPTPGSIS